MKMSSAWVSAAILPIIMGLAQLAPASAALISAAPFKFLVGDQSARVQMVHCRHFVHVHRRCTLWSAGICRRWVRYTHRCS